MFPCGGPSIVFLFVIFLPSITMQQATSTPRTTAPSAKKPSLRPTHAPHAHHAHHAPTIRPNLSTVISPTSPPIPAPSSRPSSCRPSTKPTAPSLYPTKAPSKMPSARPTPGPTVKPTYVPLITATALKSSLKLAHPRFIVSASDWQGRILNTTRKYSTAKVWTANLLKFANKCLSAPTVQRDCKANPDMLPDSENAYACVTSMAFFYNIYNNVTFAARARRDLLAIAGLCDWNPTGFLATGHFGSTVALGYDWLYSYLSESDRVTLRTALKAKVLEPARSSYEGVTDYFFQRAPGNWNFVGTSGVVLGALAIAEFDPEYAALMINYAGYSMSQNGLKAFGDDGGWAEGQMYWQFGMFALVNMLASLKSAIGTDLGLSTVTPGFAKTGEFKLHTTGPSYSENGLYFNFADSRTDGYSWPCSANMWMSTMYNQPLLAQSERAVGTWKTPLALNLIWYSDASADPGQVLPLNKMFPSISVGSMRTSWNDPKAAWVAFKGGNAKMPHGHQDMGTFVYDYNGVRWAWDLGYDSYSVPGYFANQRDEYIRTNSTGHNCLMLQGLTELDLNSASAAVAPIVNFNSDGFTSWGVLDLTKVWPGSVSVLRGYRLSMDGLLIVQDEVETVNPVGVIWRMQTMATNMIPINATSILLSMPGGQRVKVTIRQPSDGSAVFSMHQTPTGPSPQLSNAQFRTLQIILKQQVTSTRLVVMFGTPTKPSAQLVVQPISSWPNSSAPTVVPTSVPTLNPTKVPTVAPSKGPANL